MMLMGLNSNREYPTLRQVAQRFGLTYNEIEDLVECYDGDGYLGIFVAIQVGSGVGCIEPRGSQQVEAYR